MKRLLSAGLLLCVGLAAGGCSAGMVADHVPAWAGGEPGDLPPRPGSPGYEAYRQKLMHPPEPPAAQQSAQQPGAAANPSKD